MKSTLKSGLVFERHFTKGNPYEAVEWEIRDAVITNGKGETIFEQKNVEVPKFWSQTATNIVASKYFAGKLDSSEREYSVKQLVSRVVDAITLWGSKEGYFNSELDSKIFSDELAHICLNQIVAFNSPVWFNVGTKKKPYGWKWNTKENVSSSVEENDYFSQQVSACFLNSVEDSMESILDLAKTEGMLFKFGSGSGVNLSNLREEGASLGPGGTSSGPLSFAKGLDAFAGAIKSGGTTRRAAKLLCLNVDHPDVEKFIWCKAKEEKKAHDLVSLGYDSSIDGEAYSSIFYQNANNSVRVTDGFMKSVESDSYHHLFSVIDKNKIIKTLKAKSILRQISEATWQCGDPGIMYDSTINKWHTVKNSGRINTANPCIEFMHLDDTACNLSSLNLIKFLKEDNSFNIESFKHTVYVVITAMEILVGLAAYPTAKIAENSYKYRPLGLGYANLGSLLMCSGLAYDSDEGRNYAGLITALLSGQAYATSATIAGVVGSFEGYKKNKECFNEVIGMHRQAAKDMFWKKEGVDQTFYNEVENVWSFAEKLAEIYGGYRNAQVSNCAPTGTIGFMMDCDTTGIEPELALIKHKKLVGGGFLKIVNSMVPRALKKLNYSPSTIELILEKIKENESIENSGILLDEDLPVFDCSFKAAKGTRTIHYMGHVRMLAATQPFFSGAISKTINMPESATVEDIEQAYIEGWKLGLKAIAIYRDNSKTVQPLSSGSKESSKTVEIKERIVYQPVRKKLEDERAAITHKFSIGGHEGYITVGLFDDKTPGEIFITMAKEGSTISGLMDSFATSISYCLQYGVPLKFLVDKFGHVRFEPSGWTGNPTIPYAKSILDYIFRWLATKFPELEEIEDKKDKVGKLQDIHSKLEKVVDLREKSQNCFNNATARFGRGTESLTIQSDSPICMQCGGMMTPSGSCYRCENCGGTSGCS